MRTTLTLLALLMLTGCTSNPTLQRLQVQTQQAWKDLTQQPTQQPQPIAKQSTPVIQQAELNQVREIEPAPKPIVKAKPKPKPKRVVKATPKPKPKRVVKAKPKPKPKPKRVVKAKPKPKRVIKATRTCKSNKKYCKHMSSCSEARFYLNTCGRKRLDRDKDGIPCESICQ